MRSGQWHSKEKPVECTERAADKEPSKQAFQLQASDAPTMPPPPPTFDRIVPSQPVVWLFFDNSDDTLPPRLRFNLRKIEQLPRHLLLSSNLEFFLLLFYTQISHI